MASTRKPRIAPAGAVPDAPASAASAATNVPPASAIPAVAPPRVGEQIQRLRTERKMTLDDLSRAAGVSKSMLSEIERDKANPTIAVAWRLTNALGVKLDLATYPINESSEERTQDQGEQHPVFNSHIGRK